MGFSCLPGFFMKLSFKELDFKELDVFGYSDLLGLGVLGYSDLLGLGIDDWKSRCNVPPGGGTLHLPFFFQWIGFR